MTLLSLFMTSTGIFCFVPISQRLIESGIIPTSKLLVRAAVRNEDILRPADKAEDCWSETKVGVVRWKFWDTIQRWKEQEPCLTQSPLPIYPEEDTFVTNQHLLMHATWSTGTISPFPCSPAHSPNPLQSTSIDSFYDHDSTSFVSDSTLCDNCNTLLRGEIPPDHIPSVIRALALFEARDRFSDVVFDECEVVALTNAFSMLRL